MPSRDRAAPSVDSDELVRRTILADHRMLRRLISAVEHVAGLIEDGEEDLGDSLRVLMVALFRKLKVHMQYEDEVLVPALKRADAFGDVRAEAFDREHEVQREQLGELLHAACDLRAHPQQVAQRSRAILQRILVDMDYEESEFLNSDLLRDDVVGIDVESG